MAAVIDLSQLSTMTGGDAELAVEALRRLQEMVDGVATVAPARKATKPTRASQRRRVEGKRQRSEVKALRGAVRD